MATGKGAGPITKGILKLARQIDSQSAPELVPVEPGEGCLPNQSLQNVPVVVRQRGGSVQYGWRMREQPLAYVEGQFIAVWRRPDGQSVDVTPRTDGLAAIVFLPDTKLVWQGEDVEPRRLMLNEQACYCGSGLPFKVCHGLADD
jgi:hypothetical protein